MTPESDVEVAAVDVAELAARLRLSSTRLARRLRQEAEIGLSPSMLSALAVIAERGPLTLGSLAEIEAVAPPTVTKVVQRLEAAGLVDRITDPEDRRVRYVECTGLGSELLRTSRERKNAWLANKLETFSDEERATLSSALDVLETLSARSPESARDPE
ncbi:MAG TPA: MarR family transcriptional regulator [Microthrixaceae bacterium]|nr:MarR family transcriptional regulator [Microthrixaceae bacterium]